MAKLKSPQNFSPAANYFQSARKLFENSTRGKRVRDFFCRIGGCSVHLRFASEALASLILPAISHLELNPVAKPDLTIGLGDLTSLKKILEFPDEEFGKSEPKGAMWRYENARFFMLAQKETNSLSLFDAEKKSAFYWVKDVTQLPWYERTFPLRHLLAHFFRRREKHVIHAAAAGDKSGAVLIVGKGGSGKSTTTLACATNGLFYLGDDYTLVGVEPEPCVWSLYSSAKVNADTLNWFPQLKPFVQHFGGAKEKSSLLLKDAPDLRFVESLPIRAVLWPRITRRTETKLRPAPSATLLLALAPSSILQTPGGSDTMFSALSQLVQTVPTFFLEAGTDIAGIASVVKNFLNK